MQDNEDKLDVLAQYLLEKAYYRRAVYERLQQEQAKEAAGEQAGSIK